ncbi:hypothetical protein ACQJPK_005322, partial [Klebsiella pneumoniae]
MLDKVVTSTELTYTDRLGGEHYTVDGIKAEGDKVVEETRQNLIPLSRQYMTLDAAQADIANIPVNSTTYVRSQDGSALAIEVINNAGTLTATGRKMPSQESIEPLINLLKLVTYISDDEYEGSGADSAGMDSAGRWLWKWVSDVLWLKNLVVTGNLTAEKADVEEIEAGQVTINGVPVKSVD